MSEQATRPRVVFDCNVIVQAIANENGPAAEALRVVERSEAELFLSRNVLREFRAVLHYPELRRHFPQLTDEHVSAFLRRLTFCATLLKRVPNVFHYPRDRKDEPYIDLGVAAHARFLVSRDKDLLSLMTGHASICKRFRQRCRPLRIVTPHGFLRDIRRDRIE